MKCLFVERFGLNPDQTELDRFADQAYRVALDEPSEDDAAPLERALFTEMLASIADPTRTAWRGMFMADQLSVAVEILGNLLQDHRESGAETSEIVDQAIEEGILMARAAIRAVTGSVERREQ